MNRLQKFSIKEKRTYKIIVSVIVLICILMGVLSMQYYKRVQNTIKEESSGYMQEISKQMATNVSRTIKDNFAVLETLSSVFQGKEITNYAQVAAMVAELQDGWNYQKILLIDKNGVSYDENGKIVVMGNNDYLQDVIVQKQQSMVPSQTINGKESIVFSIPVEPLILGDREIVALGASYDLSTFDRILSMTAFDGKGYAHIIRKDGTMVIRSSSGNALLVGYNVLTSLSKATFDKSKSIADIKADILLGNNGQTEFMLQDDNEYMTYTPLEMEEWVLLTFVPVAVVNAKSEMLLNITLLICSLITIIFAILIAMVVFTFYRNKRRLEKIAYVDPITGGNTIQRFYDISEDVLQGLDKKQYALVYTNIKKFKVLNEQFGRPACDNTLRVIENTINEELASDECIGRLFADNFCVLVEYKDEESLAQRFQNWYQESYNNVEKQGSVWLPLIMEFGVFVIDNTTMPFPHMVDRAKLALSEATVELRGKLRYAVYDEQVRRVLLREKQLEDMMEDALENNEFEVYLQPKYFTQSESIGGAEALIRWNSSKEGMIYPDEFIELFEKNGFIVPMDLWVFEEVCKMIRRWMDEGKDVIKVSVNCSRVHLKNPNFLERYCEIAKNHNIPPEYLEIELTENTVFEDVEALTCTIERIHEAGFGCSMDDFGSGYSSLNLIQDIPVDTIKLDRVFFRSSSKDTARTESVIGSIISMAKALSMDTVVEGVEQRHQVDMLKRLNCDYVQGYYFAKPMPIGEFETLAFCKGECPISDEKN